ncbi:AraC family transcriptional regulator [Zestomonas thermotolerans]|uniref:AraC family transcriptional regulator n=1 Tax=Zestomonas thermotolerans TaxID=157784 RepID=UPI0004887DF9|nr:AraC family transcriptional regulator [Pseudomonas thermotolerans]
MIRPADDLRPRQEELVALLHRLTHEEGVRPTIIEGLFVVRCNQPTPPMPGIYQPSLCVIAQGRKEIRVGDATFLYDSLHYLVASVTLPVAGQVIEASPERPYLSMRLDFAPAQISRLIAEAGPFAVDGEGSECGLTITRLDAALLDALIRLVGLLETPQDIPFLAPMIQREILYRVMNGPQGRILQAIAAADSQDHRIARAIEWLNENFHRPLRIEELARTVNLSPSTLHHRFKAVTALSPLQYQKQLRLQEARRLMVTEGLEAAAASYRVGYESPSQFSREYSRLFGAPPLRDLGRLRPSVRNILTR